MMSDFLMTAFEVLGTLCTIVGAVILGTLVLVLVAEFIARIVNGVRRELYTTVVRRADYLDPGYHPYLRWTENWDKAMFQYLPVGFRLFNTENEIPGRVVNNSLGYRTAEFSAPSSEDYTVVILGGSQAWGDGASSNDATIAGQLQKSLNESGALPAGKTRARVFNLAQVNGNQTQDVLSLIFHGAVLAPDLVISIGGWNEIVANYPLKTDIMDKFEVFYLNELEWWEPEQVSGRRAKDLRRKLRETLSTKSELANMVLNRNGDAAEDDFDYSVAELEARMPVANRLFVRHLEIMNKLAGGFGFEHVQVMQPFLYRKRELTPAEARIVELYDDVRPVHGGKVVGDYLRERNVYDPVVGKTSGREREYGRVLNLSDMMADETETLFYTLVHLNDRGYAMIAEAIHRYVLDEILTVTPQAEGETP